MRKTFSSIRILFLISVLSFVGGVNFVAQAQEVTLDFSKNTWGLPEGSNNKATEQATFTDTKTNYAITLTGSNGNGYYFNTSGYLMLGKSGATLTLPAFSFDVEKIEIEGQNNASKNVKQNFYVGDATVSTETTGAQGTNSYEIAADYQAAGNIYVLKVTSSNNTQITKINIYKKGSSAVTVATPTFSQEAGTFEEPFTLTLATTTEGATIHYTLDGTEPTAQSTTYTTGISISATTTVKAIAVDTEGNASKVATATYTYVKSVYDNLADLKAVAQSGTQYKVKLTNAIVTYVNGQNAYLEDGTAGILVYFKDHGLKEGNVLSGTATVTYTVYQGTNEFTAMSGYTVAEEAGTITATELTLKEILANMAKYESMRVKVVKAVAQDEQFGSDKDHRSATIKQGESEITLYNGYTSSGYDDYIQNAYIDVIGYPVEFVKSGTTLNQLKVWTDGITGYKETIKVTSAGYATHYSENAYILPEGLTAATITAGAESGKISINYNYEAASTVPALSPVLLKGAAATYKCTIVASTEAADANTLLHGSTTDVTTAIDGEATYYKLSYNNNGENLGFYWGADNGAAFTSKGGLCYLAIPTSLSQSQLTGFAFADMEKATGIDSLPAAEPAAPRAIYTLDGRRVQTMNAKGIYIVDGQKRIVK